METSVPFLSPFPSTSPFLSSSSSHSTRATDTSENNFSNSSRNTIMSRHELDALRNNRNNSEAITSNSESVPVPVHLDRALKSQTQTESSASAASRMRVSTADQVSVTYALSSPTPSFTSSLDFLVGDSDSRRSQSFDTKKERESSRTVSATKRALDKEQAASVLSSEVGDRLLVIAGSLLEVSSSSTRDRDSGSGSEGERVQEKEKEVLDSIGVEGDIECHAADMEAVSQSQSQSQSQSDDMLEKIKWLEERLKAESKLRISTSKKLLLLANVLSGRSNIGEFDSLNSP